MRDSFPVTVHLLLVEDSRILLLRRFNTGYEDGKYSVPAGHLDGGETVTQAAVREGMEELGIMIEAQDISFAGVMHRKAEDERIDFFVRVARWAGEPQNREPHKCDQLRWCEMDDLPENLIPYVRRALENYRSQRWLDEFGWATSMQNMDQELAT